MERITLKLKELGVDVDNVIYRLGGNEKIYLSICQKFLKDTSYRAFCQAWSKNDIKSAIIHIHTLKGVAVNLGFIRIELLCKSIQDDLKNNDILYTQEYISELSTEYENIIEILNNL